MPDLVRRPDSESGFHLDPAQQVIAAVAVLGVIAALLGYAFFFFVLIVPECLTALLWYTVYVATPNNIPTAKPDVEKIGCWTVVLGVFMLTAALIVMTGHYTGRGIQDGDVAALIWFHIMSFGLQWAWFRYYGFKLRHPMTERDAARDAKRKVQAKAEFLRQFKESEWTVSMRETMLKAMDQVLKTPEDEWLHPFHLFTYAELKDLYEWLRDKVSAKPDPVKSEPSRPTRPVDPNQRTFYVRPQDVTEPPPPAKPSAEELRRIAIKEYERLKAVAEQWRSNVDIEVEMDRVSRETTRRYSPSKYDLAASEYPLLDNERLAQYAHLLRVLRDKVRYQGSTPAKPTEPIFTPADLEARRRRAVEELSRLKRAHESDDGDELELEHKRAYREYSRDVRNTNTGFMNWDASPSEYPLLDRERLHQYMDWLDVMRIRAKRGDAISRADATPLGRTEAGERVLLPDNTRQDLSIIGGKQTGKSNALEHVILHDLTKNRGMAFVDPHGDSTKKLLKFIPANLIDRTIYFSPEDYITPLDVLHTDDPAEANFIANDMIGLFHRLTSGWGDSMEMIVRNVVRTLVLTGPSCFMDIENILIDSTFQTKKVAALEAIQDPELASAQRRLLHFWQVQFPGINKASLQAVLTRLNPFTSDPFIEKILGIPDAPLKIGKEVEKETVMLFRIPKGILSPSCSMILGTLIVSQLQLAFFRRARIPEDQRKPFYLYVDEFQNFTTSGFDVILSELGKYQVFLTLVNQALSQLKSDTVLRDSIISNVREYILLPGLSGSDLFLLADKLGKDGIELVQSLTPKHTAVFRDQYGSVRKFVAEKPIKPTGPDYSEQIKENTRKRFGAPPPSLPATSPSQNPPVPPGSQSSNPPSGHSRPGSSPKPN